MTYCRTPQVRENICEQGNKQLSDGAIQPKIFVASAVLRRGRGVNRLCVHGGMLLVALQVEAESGPEGQAGRDQPENSVANYVSDALQGVIPRLIAA